MQLHYQNINTLLEKSKDENSEAFLELFDFYKPLLFAAFKRCATKDTRIQDLKDDFESELILIFKDLVSKYNQDLSHFSYYVSKHIDYAIYVRSRQLLNLHTNAEEINFSDMPDGWEAGYKEDPFGKLEEKISIELAVQKLSKRHREVVKLYFYQGLQQSEAAEKLSITQTSFSRRLGRAMDKLRLYLEN